jgi:hypothetical protein
MIKLEFFIMCQHYDFPADRKHGQTTQLVAKPIVNYGKTRNTLKKYFPQLEYK